jgi:hypothetical protein
MFQTPTTICIWPLPALGRATITFARRGDLYARACEVAARQRQPRSDDPFACGLGGPRRQPGLPRR